MHRLIRVIICTIAFLLEAFFLFFPADAQWALFLLLLGMHLGACSLFAYGINGFFPAGKGWGWITLFCTCFLGIYGFCGMLFVLILMRTRKQQGQVFHLDIDEDEEPGDDTGERLALEYREAEILEVESLGDILVGDDKALRLGAIDALLELKDSNAISMLAASLDSTFHEVRYYAVEALNRIAQEYLDKITVLQQMVEIKPGDHMIRRTLADIYFDYANKGIEETSIQEYYYRLAAREYRALLQENREDVELHMNLVEAEYRLKNYAVCCSLLDELPAAEAAGSRVMELLADCLLKTREYGKLAKLCARLVKDGSLPVEIRQAAEMWLQVNE